MFADSAQSMSTTTPLRIPTTTLRLWATLSGLVGTALVIMQALLWTTPSHANHAVLILTALVPFIAAVVFALAPRHVMQDSAQSHPLHSPIVWVNLTLPLLLTLLTMILVAVSGSFDNFAGFALLLAANAGRNLRDFVQALLMPASGGRP